MRSDRQRRGADLAVIGLKSIGQAAAIAAAGLLGFSKSYATIANLQAAELRLELIARSFPEHPIHLERHDMTTVTITAPTTAPTALVDALIAFARDLDSDGIHVDLSLTRTCIVCGCTDDRACYLGCSWITKTDDLCSTCDDAAGRSLLEQLNADRDSRIHHLPYLIAQADAHTTTTQKGGE